MNETHEQMIKDAETIFTAVSTSSDNFAEAEKMVVFAYVPDMSFSRSGISLALKQLKNHYERGQ